MAQQNDDIRVLNEKLATAQQQLERIRTQQQHHATQHRHSASLESCTSNSSHNFYKFSAGGGGGERVSSSTAASKSQNTSLFENTKNGEQENTCARVNSQTHQPSRTAQNTHNQSLLLLASAAHSKLSLDRDLSIGGELLFGEDYYQDENELEYNNNNNNNNIDNENEADFDYEEGNQNDRVPQTRNATDLQRAVALPSGRI